MLAALTCAALLVAAAPGSAQGAKGTVKLGGFGNLSKEPVTVVALIDSGIDPYSPAFRDDGPLGHKHPSKYIPGYPKDAEALKLSLELPYEKAIEADADVWKAVRPNQLYWIPGTKIIGAISLGSGGTNCPVVPAPPANILQGDCAETRILDDHGHGTMTASRAAGSPNSLDPKARIVAIEGLGGGSVRWAADQGWIDVQSNSWINFVPQPAGGSTTEAFSYASTRTLTLAASGNGTAYITGFAPTPTYLLSTAPPGVVLVGGHDNGKMTAWAGAPPHIVADAYSGFTGIRGSTEPMRPDPIACCTSAASPYAAGAASAIIRESREILGDYTPGIVDGIVAMGCGGPKKGPLKDGTFTLDELKDVLFHTAEAHPDEGRDDGDVHWAGDPRAPDHTEFGPGGNPFCAGCTTMPVAWSDIPENPASYQMIGYGSTNERSTKLAHQVLAGKTELPARPEADAQYEQDQAIRSMLYPSGEQVREVSIFGCISVAAGDGKPR